MRHESTAVWAGYHNYVFDDLALLYDGCRRFVCGLFMVRASQFEPSWEEWFLVAVGFLGAGVGI